MSKTVVITGGSRGIGLSIAKYFSRQKYDVYLLSKNKPRLDKVAANLSAQFGNKVYPIAADVKHYKHVRQLLSAYFDKNKKLDVLVNSAGVFDFGTRDLSTSSMTEMLETNVNSTHNLCSYFYDNLVLAQRGYIFNISSVAGLDAYPFIGGYVASKHAIVGYSKSLSQELRGKNVMVTAICPDVVDTDMSSSAQLPKDKMIPVDDVVCTVDYLMNLSPCAHIDCVRLNCTNIDKDSLSR